MVSKQISKINYVWRATKKPTKPEYMQTLKIVLIGLLIIGAIALIMEFLSVLVIKPLFS
ncbi:MAG: protein translocase SEC61 complex subunit gamma [Candidatus Nanoarchaeia archaeon]